MKRPRPYIPWSIRREVALCQLWRKSPVSACVFDDSQESDGVVTKHVLKLLFGDDKFALDHDPALILREFNPRTGKYKPDANDPAHLIYRVVEDHHIKTNVSGDGALRSDTAERVHRRRLEKNRDRREATAAGKPKRLKLTLRESKKRWPKGQKIRSRGFR